MKAIIGLDSPLYLKRLVRELNDQEHGFYASISAMNVRCYKARIRAGAIQVKSLACSPQWFEPSDVVMRFIDPYGREIVASRKVKP